MKPLKITAPGYDSSNVDRRRQSVAGEDGRGAATADTDIHADADAGRTTDCYSAVQDTRPQSVYGRGKEQESLVQDDETPETADMGETLVATADLAPLARESLQSTLAKRCKLCHLDGVQDLRMHLT